MNTTLLLMPLDDTRLRWTRAGDAAANANANGEIDSAALTSLCGEDRAAVVFVVPGECLLLDAVDFTPQERRLLRQTVPYGMEESLLADVGTLHFAFGPLQADTVPVAVVEREWLARWLAAIAQAGLEVRAVQPEPLLLPWEEGSWTLRVDGERWIARLGEFRGFALERDAALLALTLATETDGAPQQLAIDGGTGDLIEMLPGPLRAVASLQDLGRPDLSGRLDLRQGAFARRLPWRRWTARWRWPAAAVAAAVLVQFGVVALEHERLGDQNIELRRQIEQTYRSVEPNGALTDAEIQLRRKVASLSGSAAGGFLALFEQLGSGLAGAPGLALQSLSYSETQREIRINVTADSFDAVEAARLAIADHGLRAELVGSSADAERTRAQLRVWEE